MSSDDERDSVVRQRKEGTAAVSWREYEALRDHLSRQFNNQCDKIWRVTPTPKVVDVLLLLGIK